MNPGRSVLSVPALGWCLPEKPTGRGSSRAEGVHSEGKGTNGFIVRC